MINEIKNSRKNKVVCPLCDKKAKAEALSVWSLKDGTIVCSYGVCGSCADKQNILTAKLMAHVCEYKLMKRYKSIREKLPQDEIIRIEQNMSELT